MTDQLFKKIILVIMFLSSLLAGIASGHEENVRGNIGIVEKKGQHVPLDLAFRDENGTPVKLISFVNKPTILTMVYHTCNNVCPLTLGGLANTIGNLQLTPGKDYAVVTISFDDSDTPAIAKERKANYITAIGKPFPEDAWKFLTGSKESISTLTESVGFNFQKEARGYIHPSVLIFLAPDGKIIKYLYVEQSHYGTLSPVAFSPEQITMALKDALRGRVRAGTINPVRLCFPNLSEEETLFYSVLAGVGMATLLCIAAFFIYLRRTGRKAATEDRKN